MSNHDDPTQGPTPGPTPGGVPLGKQPASDDPWAPLPPTGDAPLPPAAPTPPYGQPPTPYAPAPPPYGQTPPPYGQVPPPYGQVPNPYATGPVPPAAPTDTVSIIGLVLSFTCCLSFVGVILGLVGLGRTKGGQRRGRWAAITAIVLGVLLTIGSVVGVVLVQKIDFPYYVDDAEVGDCVNVSNETDTELQLTGRDCDEEHDGEIAYVGEQSELVGLVSDGSDAGICSALVSSRIGAIITPGNFEYVLLNADSSPSPDEGFVCLVRRGDDRPFTEPLL